MQEEEMFIRKNGTGWNHNNTGSYFDQKLNMTYNHLCPCCGVPTWCQEGIHPMHEGKRYVKRRPSRDGTYNVVGIISQDGIYCERCYEAKSNSL